MMCVFFFFFFVSVYSITSRKNFQFQTMEVVSDVKVNILVFKKIEKNKKKMTEKREFLRKTSFRPNRIFYMVVIQKLITENT
ncbi:Uncharacterized protein FWK35_00034820, partial [Aphis craccivora]